jgi:hypothetical protein
MENTKRLLPRARQNGLVACEVADELLVYDLFQYKAHHLNSAAALVWRLCDGQTRVPEIARAINSKHAITLSNEAVWFALEQLERAQLMITVGTPTPAAQERQSESRRRTSSLVARCELIKWAGVAGAMGMPLVSPIAIPTAEAESCRARGGACSPDGPNSACCSGTCVLGLCS